MDCKEVEYKNIIRIMESSRVEIVNEYLDLGWLLLKIDHNSNYILGWNKENGEIREPEYMGNLPF